MRASLALLVFVSLPAFACPNLSGNYKICHSSKPGVPATSLMIEQKLVNKVHQFTFTSNEVSVEEARVDKYSADGKSQSVSDIDPDTGIAIKTTTWASCSASTLTIKMNATVDSETFANITIQSSKNGNQLVQTYAGTSMGESVSETITCE